jgi:poly [ADP-ribose] polymerase 2/3/4
LVLGNGTLESALKEYDSKFKSKTGLKWVDRGEKAKLGKYTFVERSYNVDSDEEEARQVAPAKGKSKWIPPKCTLSPAIQELLRLIFNKQFFAASMNALKYDANKLPLGKLSKATITKGFQALRDLSDLIADQSLAASYELPYAEALEQLSNAYYSLIPHAFGRNRPPVISMLEMVKTEIELLE